MNWDYTPLDRKEKSQEENLGVSPSAHSARSSQPVRPTASHGGDATTRRRSKAVGFLVNDNTIPVNDNPPVFGHPDVHLGEGSQAVFPVFPVNIAIADKNPMVLAALEALLTRDKRFNLLLMAGDGERFLQALGRLPISLAVIGWELPMMHARDVLQTLSRRPGAPKVVVYSGTRDPAAPADTLRLGGAGFVSKLSPPERLLEVFAAVAAGDMVFPFVDIQKGRVDPLAGLTHRERDLLAALESGQSNAQLAREFGVSINTIKFHLRNLFCKLDVRNRTQAICQYLEMKR